MKEIERKFLLKTPGKIPGVIMAASFIRQIYFVHENNTHLRIRIEDNRAWFCVKGPRKGICRTEIEFEIPKDTALSIFDICSEPILCKVRYTIKYQNNIWFIDIFKGDNEGLCICEIELEKETEELEIPEWAGMEVSNDERFYNQNLVKNPFSKWGDLSKCEPQDHSSNT